MTATSWEDSNPWHFAGQLRGRQSSGAGPAAVQGDGAKRYRGGVTWSGRQMAGPWNGKAQRVTSGLSYHLFILYIVAIAANPRWCMIIADIKSLCANTQLN